MGGPRPLTGRYGLAVVEVELREVEDGDLETLYEHQLDEQAANMAGFPSRGRDAFIAHWERIRADPECITLSIVADGALAGNLGCFPDVGKRAVGYWIGKEFWGKGIATAAGHALIDHLRADARFVRLEAPVFEWNPASMRVLEKLGFERVAVLRKSVTKDGQLIDSVLYSYLL